MRDAKNNAEQKARNSYSRFEDAMKKVKEMEQTLDEQEKVMIKRHNDINSLLKENRKMKDDMDYITSQFGTVAEIKQKMDIVNMKEKKINELVDNLDTSIVSYFSNMNDQIC